MVGACLVTSMPWAMVLTAFLVENWFETQQLDGPLLDSFCKYSL